jgi:NAD(P)-dependent dehydrogenase (short-subunit alcohol dehydrogenase family)
MLELVTTRPELYLADKKTRRALIVGGSGGIGAAVSKKLAEQDLQLVIHGGRDRAKLQALGNSLRDRGCPVTEVQQVIESADDGQVILSRAGEIDILVVAFGPYEEQPVTSASVEAVRRMVELNYTLAAGMIASTLPRMIDRGYGRILVFGTTFGDRIEGYRQSPTYAAAKTALASFVRSAARSVTTGQIRCNMVCPGYVVTEYHSADTADRYARRSARGDAQTPEQIAALAGWLVSDENTSVNGAVIPADDGL